MFSFIPPALLDVLFNLALTLVIMAGMFLCARWLYYAGVKDGRALQRAETRRDEAEAKLAETQAKYTTV